MIKRSYIFINGINTNTESVNGWTDLAESWVLNHTGFHAQRYEYRAGTLTRRFFQEDRVNNLGTMVKRIEDSKVYLVGHSNGCDIICRLLDRMCYKVEEIHLVAAACEHDFDKNGLNAVLHSDRVKNVYVYCSRRDEALRKASFTSKFLHYIGLGYGYLGLVGPKNVDMKVHHRVETIWEDYLHSDWWSISNFDNTMKMIVGAR